MVILLRSIHEATDTEQLLIQDPSGFLLIDQTVKQLKNPSQRTHYQRIIMESLVPDYVIAGAGLAQRAYGKLYPLTEVSSSRNNPL